MPAVDEVLLPPPNVRKRRRALRTREEAYKVMRTVDDAGFSCTLFAKADGEARQYEVMAPIEAMPADELNRLLSAMTTTEASVRVDGRYLVAS